ncbi:MAG: glycosyltransferase family 2 protein [Candidatus Omnitrophota bacterium]
MIPDSLSIIIVNYNTGELLVRCVESALNKFNYLQDEIIIIDNASTDQSLVKLKALARAASSIEIIKNSQNQGFAAGVNQGIKRAKGNYIVLLNPDAQLKGSVLENLKKVLTDNPQAGCCGPKLINQDLSLQMSVHSYPKLLDIIFDKTHLAYFFPKSKILTRFQMSYWNHEQMREVDWMSGACLMVRKTVIENIGLLDERFFMFCEDIDLCLRIKQAGWKNIYVPDACVLHLKGKSSPQLEGKAPVVSWVSLVKYWAKHKGKGKAQMLRVLLCSDAFLKLVIVILLKIITLNKIPGKRQAEYFKQILMNLVKMKV